MNSTPVTKKPMSKDEILLLLNLIEQLPVLTTKETNAATNKSKEEAWTKLALRFNSKCGSIPRTKDQLKLKWDNLKKSARKRNQNIRLNLNKTGGGKPDFIPPDEILEKVSSMMGSTLTGFAVPFGGDGFSDETYEEETVNIEDMIILGVEDNQPNQQSPEMDLLPKGIEARKRKIDFSAHDYTTIAGPSTPVDRKKEKYLYGMPTMSTSLQSKGKKMKKKEYDDGKEQKNLAIANYFNKMTEKVELEIKLLKKQLGYTENI